MDFNFWVGLFLLFLVIGWFEMFNNVVFMLSTIISISTPVVLGFIVGYFIGTYIDIPYLNFILGCLLALWFTRLMLKTKLNKEI